MFGPIPPKSTNLSLAISMNLAETKRHSAKEEIGFSPEKASTYIQEMSTQVSQAEKILTSRDNWFKSTGRSFLKLFGIVTKHERIKVQVEQLRKDANALTELNERTTPQAEEKFKAAKKDLEQSFTDINSQSTAAKLHLDEVNKRLDSIEVRLMEFDPTLIRSQLSEINELLVIIYPTIKQLYQIYEDVPNMRNVHATVNLYTKIYNRVKELSSIASALQVSKKPTYTPPPKASHGGIKNSGNSCFLASVMQTISVIPQLSALFTYSGNEVQKQGYQLLFKIQTGQSVERTEILAFRKACIKAGIVKTKYGQEDAQEILGNLIDYLGSSLAIKWSRQEMPINTENAKLQPFKLGEDPFELSTIDELKAGGEEDLAIEVTPFTGMNMAQLAQINPNEDFTVNMQKMVNSFWAPEQVEVNARVWSEKERCFLKHTSDAIRFKEPVANTLPPALTINVKQLEGVKVIPTDVDTIYPYGVDENGKGIGPAYRLAAVIEHRPGHYVARVRNAEGRVVEANDNLVRVIGSFEGCPGCGYTYVRVDD